MSIIESFRKPIKIVHALTIGSLSLFSLIIGILLFVQSHNHPSLAPLSTLTITAYLLGFGIVMFILGIIAIIASIRKNIMYLHVYEIICLIGFVLFALVFAILIFSTNSQQKQQNKDCFTPSNYFQFKMLEAATKAQSLYCTERCPCNENKTFNKVQQCRDWQEHSFQDIFVEMEKSFRCSGWCSINQVSYYHFNDKNTIQIPQEGEKKACFYAWDEWLKGQQSIINIFFGVQISLLFMAILFTNMRIIDLGDDFVV